MRRIIVFVLCVETMLSSVFCGDCFAQENVYISRSQIATEVIEIYENVTKSRISVNFSTPPFEDIQKNRSDIEKCYGLDIMKGVDENKFAPNDCVTRAQACVIIFRLLNQMDTWKNEGKNSHETFEYCSEDDWSKEERFSDDTDIPAWAKYSVYAMKSKGYVVGDENRMLNPDKYITTEQLNTVLSKIVETYK